MARRPVVYLGLVGLVVLGTSYFLYQWLGFWGLVLAVLIIVGAFWLYSTIRDFPPTRP